MVLVTILYKIWGHYASSCCWRFVGSIRQGTRLLTLRDGDDFKATLDPSPIVSTSSELHMRKHRDPTSNRNS